LKPRIRPALLVLAVVPFLVFSSPGEAEHGSGMMAFLGKTINFLVLFGGLGYLLRKPVRGMLDKRASGIRASIEEAEKSRIAAREKYENSAARIAGIEDEALRLKKEAESEGRREKERISALAQAEAEKIRRLALQEIDLQVKSRVRELRTYAAEAATRIAEGNMRKRLDLEGQSALIDRSIGRLSECDGKEDTR